MKHVQALEKITKSIIADNLVEAIYLKGDMVNNTYPEYSIIELYLVVGKRQLDRVLDKRIEYLESYGCLLYYNFSVDNNLKMTCVFEDGLKVNLYTETIDKIMNDLPIVIIYDPNNRLANYKIKDFRVSSVDIAEYFNLFNYTLLEFEVAYNKNDIALILNITNKLYSYFGVILLILSKPNISNIRLEGLYDNLDNYYKEIYFSIFKKLSGINLLEIVYEMVLIVDDLIMRLPLEVAQYINYDFHLHTKKAIFSLL